MTKQTLSKKIRQAVDLVLDAHGILDGGISVELAETISAIVREHREPREKIVTCPAEWMTALYHLCGQDARLASPAMRKRISDAGIALVNIDADIRNVDRFGREWRSRDWRGRQGQPPTPEQVRDNWGVLLNTSRGDRSERPAMTPDQAAAMFDPRV